MNKSNYIWLFLVLLSACKQGDDLFKSYGPETTEIRQVGNFNKILAGEKFDVILVQDSAKAGTVEMTAGKNVIDGYTSIVNNGELRIANDNKFNWVRKLQVRQRVVVYFRYLDRLQINGSAKFSCPDSIVNNGTIEINHGGLEDADLRIKGDYIYVNGTNTGGVNLSGSCFLLSASIDDISFINALDMKAEKCYISSFSKDDSYVSALNVLDIRLYGNGSVYYASDSSTATFFERKGSGNIHKY